jgi:hypothetical protein
VKTRRFQTRRKSIRSIPGTEYSVRSRYVLHELFPYNHPRLKYRVEISFRTEYSRINRDQPTCSHAHYAVATISKYYSMECCR